jgi:uncharacterized protein
MKMHRREFVLNGGIIAVGSLVAPAGILTSASPKEYVSRRPAPGTRKFTSEEIEKVIREVKAAIADPELAWMFENCFPNTLDTTVEFTNMGGIPDTFVITGDIHAMWLRDSTAQVWPYLPYVTRDPGLHQLILGVINRQSECILIDPYANAFNKEATGSEWKSDLTDMKPELHERKWEIDSLCYPVRLAYHFWKKTGDSSFFTEAWKKSARLILRTLKEQQRKEGKGPYHFMRTTEKATDTVTGAGYGNPVKPVGLICSSFRPSDDATVFSFLIPSNYFAVNTLRQLAEMFTALGKDSVFTGECISMAMEVENALSRFARADYGEYGMILAFEADGYGNQLFIDDANVPSLLGLPYLGCMDANDPLYRNTRKFVLSSGNPWYFKGKAGEGIGGPHVGEYMIWPLSIIMQAMTSVDKTEIAACLKILKNTHAGTGFMHESFHKDDPSKYTRSWFAWANTLFGELILKVYHENREILDQVF